MSYDPRNINQMYEQYSKTHSSKPVKFNKSPLDDDTSSSFDQFTRRETTRGLGSPTKPDDDDKQEDTGGVKGFFSRVFNLFDNSGAKKSTPIDYEGSSVYSRKEFDIKPTPVSVSELDDAPQGYDPLGINTRDFGKGVDTFNTDTDPEIPQTAMIDIGNPNKEDVNRGTSSRLAKAAAVSAGLMTPALPGMADAVNRTLSSLRMDSTEVPYVIQAGDTLSDIAAKTGTTVNDLVKANNIENKNKIYTGEELVIPTERTTMTKDDLVSAIIRGYERDKDMSGVQVASADPDAQFYNSFRQGVTESLHSGKMKSKDEFLKVMIPVAKNIAEKTGLDYRMIVAQAAIETGWGSKVKGNSFFGVKGHGAKNTIDFKTQEEVDGKRVTKTDTFRAYENVGEAASDYGQFLQNNPRYSEYLAANNLEDAAAALQASGYATDSKYGEKVLTTARGKTLRNFLEKNPEYR